MKTLALPKKLDPFVKEIVFLENKAGLASHQIPFYADGFTGIVFSKSSHPFSIQPQNKVLPDFYLYGQTIKPMSLLVTGDYELYAIRLYPSALRTLVGIDVRTLNDDCYDLSQIENMDTAHFANLLRTAPNQIEIVNILVDYFEELVKNAALNPDHRVMLATNLILKSNGNIKVSEIRNRLHITERTLERQFLKETGVTPLQFAKIIQFHSTIQQLSEKDYINLTDIGFKSGYADQSHFIRSFKKYTGKTPKEFQKMLSE